MAIDNLSLKIIADALREQLVGSTFGNPLSLGEHHFGIPFSEVLKDEIRHGTFLFSMEPNNPFVSYSNKRYTKVNDTSPFFNSLKKLALSTVTAVEKRKGERILTIRTKSNANDLTEINSGYDLIIELFPNRPNCYLIAYPYGKIVSLYKEKTDIEKGIFVTRNVPYVYPPMREELSSDVESIEETRTYLTNALYKKLVRYVESGNDLHDTLYKMLSSKQLYLYGKYIIPFSFDLAQATPLAIEEIDSCLIGDQKALAKKEKEKDLSELIDKALKVAHKKKKNLIEDLNRAKEKMIYQEYGQWIYMYQAEIKKGDTLLERDGKRIELNPLLDAPNNANRYFKMYRKAKTGISILTSLIEKSEDEIAYLEKKRVEASDGSPRDILELKSELLQEGYIKEKQSKRYIPKVHKSKKYEPHFVILPHAKIGFGMNGLQNEHLTFDLAMKDDLFFHVKDYPGAHVVLFSDHPDDEEIRIACELALYLSHLKDGIVMIAKKRDVKKNPNRLGLVHILKYETLAVKEVRASSIELFEQSRRG